MGKCLTALLKDGNMIIEVKVTWGSDDIGRSLVIDDYEIRQAVSSSALLKVKFEQLAEEFIKQMKLD